MMIHSKWFRLCNSIKIIWLKWSALHYIFIIIIRFVQIFVFMSIFRTIPTVIPKQKEALSFQNKSSWNMTLLHEIFWIFGKANLLHQMFFVFLDVLFMFLEKSEEIFPFFSNKARAVVACLNFSNVKDITFCSQEYISNIV